MLKSSRTVFSLQSLMQLTGNFDRRSLSRSLYYYRKQGSVSSPRAGIYVLDSYNVEEMACAVFSTGYISLQYVLRKAGVIFQFSDAVTCVCPLSRNLVIDGREYVYRRIRPEIWAGMRGIVQEGGYCIARPERAALDVMYLYPEIGYFDNPGKLDLDFMISLLPDYDNKQLNNRVEKWIRTGI